MSLKKFWFFTFLIIFAAVSFLSVVTDLVIIKDLKNKEIIRLELETAVATAANNALKEQTFYVVMDFINRPKLSYDLSMEEVINLEANLKHFVGSENFNCDKTWEFYNGVPTSEMTCIFNLESEQILPNEPQNEWWIILENAKINVYSLFIEQ